MLMYGAGSQPNTAEKDICERWELTARPASRNRTVAPNSRRTGPEMTNKANNLLAASRIMPFNNQLHLTCWHMRKS